MKITLAACIAAAFLPLAAPLAVAEPAATAASPKVLNKDAAKPVDGAAVAADSKAATVVAKAEVEAQPQADAKAKAEAKPAAKPEPTSDAKAEAAAAPAGTAAKPADKADAGEQTVAKTVAPPPKPKPTVAIAVDLSRQRMTVSEDGVEKYQWPISSGRSGYATPTGNYRPQWMAKMWRSRKYDDAPMPHSIFFTGGFAIHATYATGMLGRPASHGCVRLSPANAATLFKLVQAHGMDRTKIAVFGSPHFSEPAVARRDDDGRRRSVADASRSGQQRVAYGYGQPVRYVAQPPQQQGLLASIFGSNQPAPVAVRQQPVRYQAQQQQRPVYVYTQDGRMVRVR